MDMARGQKPSPKPEQATYIDVDVWLRDLTRASSRATWSSIAIADSGFKHFDDLDRHLKAMDRDPAYAERYASLVASAEAWAGDLASFVDKHKDDLPFKVPGRGTVRGLVERLTCGRAARDRHVLAAEALMALTGTDTFSAGRQYADSRRPVIDVEWLDENITTVEPAERGMISRTWSRDPLTDARRCDVLLQSLERARNGLGEVAVESAMDDTTPGASEARALLKEHRSRSRSPWQRRLPMANEESLREALALLGYPPATDIIDLGHQARHAAEASPDHLNWLLSAARHDADELMRLTNRSDLQSALDRAAETIKLNQPQTERPRTGTIVYSGGLPSLGKRR